MITVRTFVNNTEAWLARSLLESEGINAVVADDNMNGGYASLALRARLQVAEEDEQRALEVLGKHEGFEPLTDDFVPPETATAPEQEISDEKPPSLAQQWGPLAFYGLVVIAGAITLFLWFAPPQWLYSPSELVHRGNTAFESGNYDDALRYYNGALTTDPSSDAARYDRGLAYYHKKEYAKALADFSEDIISRPDHVSGYIERGRVYMKMDEPERALADFDKAISIEPDVGTNYHDRGWAYEKIEEWDKAVSDFDTAIRLNPGDYLSLSHRAYCKNRLGNYDEALVDANEVLRLSPDHQQVLVTRALIYSHLEQYDKALADLDGFIQRNPGDAIAYENRSSVYIRMEQYDKALTDASKGAEIDPKERVAFVNRGWAYFKLGDGKKAVADVSHSIELDPGKWESYDDLAWIYSTSPQADVRDGAKAMQLAGKACEISHWKECRAIGALAAAEAETGKFDDAVKHAAQALDMARGDKTVDKKTLGKMTDALAAFREGKPYRDTTK